MQPRERHRAPMLILCATAVAARLIVGAHVTDDAYITMRYSRNLSSTGAMSYNPPDAVLGTSTPLWTWVLAAGELAGVRASTTAIAASTVADVVSIVVIMTSPVAGSLGALAASAAIAAWPAYVAYAVSGMETSLYVLTIVAFVAALTRTPGHVAGAAIAASAAALCRPDGALLVVLGSAWLLATASAPAAGRFVALCALLSAPWALYATVRFGSFVPASVSAKAAAGDPWFLSLANVYAYFFHGGYILLTLAAVAGFAAIAKHGHAFWRLWSVWAWSYLGAMTAANGFTHFPWYFVPLLPIYLGAAATAWEEVASRVSIAARHLSGPGARTAAAGVMGAVLLGRMPPLQAHLEAGATGREALYARVAAQLAAIDARCTVAATEIGTIGYYYPGRVLDLVGLVSPEAIGRPPAAVLAESRARWLVTYDTHFSRDVVRSEPFTSLFERQWTVRVGDARSLEVYERRDPVACGHPAQPGQPREPRQ